MSRLKRGTGMAGLTAIGLSVFSMVGGFEGLRLVAYKDVVGIATACRGETKGIRMGMRFTREQCDVMFLDSLTAHEAGMRACLKAPDALPGKTYVAFVSFTYNVGIGAFCKSTLARKVNAGDVRGACDELLKWNKAGGREISGLTRRRADERRLCLEGL